MNSLPAASNQRLDVVIVLALLCVFWVLAVPLAVQASILVSGGFDVDRSVPLANLVDAFFGLRHGRFGYGLDNDARQALPPSEVMWAGTGVAYVCSAGIAALVVACGVEQRAAVKSGFATRAEARAALGARQLRRRAATIRPDRPVRALGLIGWRIGRTRGGLASFAQSGHSLWVAFDRTACVIGPQGSGKTLDLLVPALLDAPGAALVTLTKPEDLYLTLRARARPAARTGGAERPVAVLDPFSIAPGLPRLVWDLLSGCAEPLIAERRAKAFASGVNKGTSDQSARFYAGECAKVLQGYFHAAALAGLDLDDVMTWVADPRADVRAEEILRTNPAAAPHWDGLLRGALYGDDRTAGNTITTVQQAMGLFFQASIRERCTPTRDRPATDIETLIRSNGTIYLLGREDPYASASPLMTAVTEDVLDTAKLLGETSPHGRLCPPFLATLDELPSTAPIPTLATRMANERALGISFILAAQTWRQVVRCFGDDEARTILGLSNNLIVFGGGKDVSFYREVSDLIGQRTVMREGEARSGNWWKSERTRNWSPHETPILQASELRGIPEHRALVLAEAHPPVLARLDRCISGRYARRRGWAQQLRVDQRVVRAQVTEGRAGRHNGLTLLKSGDGTHGGIVNG